jgi:hypothetical protein
MTGEFGQINEWCNQSINSARCFNVIASGKTQCQRKIFESLLGALINIKSLAKGHDVSIKRFHLSPFNEGREDSHERVLQTC